MWLKVWDRGVEGKAFRAEMHLVWRKEIHKISPGFQALTMETHLKAK